MTSGLLPSLRLHGVLYVADDRGDDHDDETYNPKAKLAGRDDAAAEDVDDAAMDNAFPTDVINAYQCCYASSVQAASCEQEKLFW